MSERYFCPRCETPQTELEIKLYRQDHQCNQCGLNFSVVPVISDISQLKDSYGEDEFKTSGLNIAFS